MTLYHNNHIGRSYEITPTSTKINKKCIFLHILHLSLITPAEIVSIREFLLCQILGDFFDSSKAN